MTMAPLSRPRTWSAFDIGLNAALAVLTSVSAWSTFDGLRRMIGDGVGHDGIGAIVIPAGVTFGLSMALLVTAHKVASVAGALRRLVWLGGYLTAALVTTSLAFAFWWALFRASSVTEDSLRAGIETALEAAQRADTRLRTLRAALDDLAAHSAERARVERAQGGTCGGPPRAGEGPRRRLREADAALFAVMAGDVGRRVEAVGAELGEMSRLAAGPVRFTEADAMVRRLRTAVTRANAMADDPLLSVVRERIAARLAQGREGFPDGAGGRFTCADPALEARLGAALSAATLPPVVLPDLTVAKGSVATFLAYRRLGATVRAWVMEVPDLPRPMSRAEREESRRQEIRVAAAQSSGTLPAPVGTGLTADDILPLGLSLVIEALILALSLLKERSPLDRLRAHVDGPPELPEDYPARLLEGLSGPRLSALSAFLSFQFRDGPDRCVALPLSVRTEPVSALTLILDLWEQDGIARRIPMSSRRVRTLLTRQASPWAEEREFIVYRLLPGLMGRLAADTLRHWSGRSRSAPSAPEPDPRPQTPSPQTEPPASAAREPSRDTSPRPGGELIVLPPRRSDDGPRWRPFRPDWRDPPPEA